MEKELKDKQICKCYKIIAPLNGALGGYVTEPMYDDHPEVASFRKYLSEPTIGDYISIRGASINVYFFKGTQISSSEEYNDYRGYDGFENLSTKEAINKYLSENKDNLLEVSSEDMIEEITIRYDIRDKTDELNNNLLWLDECKLYTPEAKYEINNYNQQISLLQKELNSLSEQLNDFTQILIGTKKPDNVKSKNQKFVDANYGEVDRDKFFKTDSGFTEVYYNPNANAGGQLVYNEISFDLIREATQNSKRVQDFFSHLDGGCTQYLIDIDTPEFKSNLDSFINCKADFEGCNKKTMNGLKKHAGIEHKKSEPER